MAKLQLALFPGTGESLGTRLAYSQVITYKGKNDCVLGVKMLKLVVSNSKGELKSVHPHEVNVY